MRICKVSMMIIGSISALFATAVSGARCINIPENAANSAVQACEDAETYQLKCGSTEYLFSRNEFIGTTVRDLTQWLSTTPYSDADLRNAIISVWVSYPDTSPDACQLRLSVVGKGGNFVRYLDPAKPFGRVELSEIAALDQAVYPESLGHRLGQIFVHLSSPYGNFAELESCASQVGDLRYREQISGNWHMLSSPQYFSEASLLRALRDLHCMKHLADDYSLNSVFEWTGWRGKAFTFPPASQYIK